MTVGNPIAADSWRHIEGRLHGLLQRLTELNEGACFSRLDDFAHECTWPLENVPPELIPKQVLCWYLYERIDPATGKTPLRTFAEREISDPVLREHLLNMEHPKWGSYLVLGVKNGLLDIKNQASGARRLAWTTPQSLAAARPGWTVRAAVHPWGPHWRLNGIVTFTESDNDALTRLGRVWDSFRRACSVSLAKNWRETGLQGWTR